MVPIPRPVHHTLLRSIMAVLDLIQDKPVKNTSCHLLLFIHPCSPLLSFVLSNEATVDQSLSFLPRHPRRLEVILITLLTLVYCARIHGFETVLVTLIWVSSVEWQLYRLAASLVTLLSAPSPCCWSP